MSESLAPAQEKWLNMAIFRLIRHTDLPLLEWDGEYTHLRTVYSQAYERVVAGKNKMWVVELPEHGLIGQVFIQLVSSRIDLADGRDRAYLYAFRIKDKFRSYGIGSKLLQIVEGDLRSMQFRESTLNVARENTRAIRFYQRHGYKIVAQEKGEWTYRDHLEVLRQVVEPAWKMAKPLNAHTAGH